MSDSITTTITRLEIDDAIRRRGAQLRYTRARARELCERELVLNYECGSQVGLGRCYGTGRAVWASDPTDPAGPRIRLVFDPGDLKAGRAAEFADELEELVRPWFCD